MYRLYIDHAGVMDNRGEYKTAENARMALTDWYVSNGYKSYYWNTYIIPEGEFAGAEHIDFGSWNTFGIIAEVK